MTAALLGNGTGVARDYNQYNGLISNAVLTDSAKKPLLIESYHYDPLENVQSRGVFWDNAGFNESFGYDNLNRLKTSTIGNDVSTFTYNEIGNIVSKTGVGTGDYAYPADGQPLPHAVIGIPGIGDFNYDDDGNLTSGAGRTARWTSFDMPDHISKGDDWSTFLYGPEHQRIRQDKADGSRIYYAGAMEVEVAASGAARVKTYWPIGLGLETEDASGTHLLWTHEDRQGSIIAITGEDGAVKERMIYDSWGKRRELDNAGTPDSIDGTTDNKGYTGHEMLDNVDLVHMNGRVYDPFISRFMSADPIIQEPEHSQSYNRYTYVWNNPTNLTDPTGFQAASASHQSSSSDSGCDLKCRIEKKAEEYCKKMSGLCTMIHFGGSRSSTTRDNSDKAAGANHSANSGGFFSTLGQRLMNAVTSGAFWTDAEKDAWGQGFKAAIAEGRSSEYLREHPFGTALKDLAFIAATPGAAAIRGMVLREAEAQVALNGTKLSVESKLSEYLLNPEHPVGGAKAKWFEQALGYNQSNMSALAKQIVFDPKVAIETGVTQYGSKFNQVIPITGANGRVIDVTFAWIRNNDGITRLVTAIPTPK